jgi:oligosaccharide repeat unit polymerase
MAIAFACVVFYGSTRSLILTGQPPLLLPLFAALLCIISLMGIKTGADPLYGSARLGFHLGLFAYFLAMPLLYSETIDRNITDSVHSTVGWMLVLVLIGFEGGYQLKKLLWRHSRRAHGYVQLKGRDRRIVVALLCVGLLTWFLTAVDYSIAARVSVWDSLFSMRGRFDAGFQSPFSQLGQWSYLLGGGLYLATAVSFLFVSSRIKQPLPVTLLCWGILVLCAVLGFLSASRALFLYSFAPLVMASWVNVSKIQMAKPLRALLIFLACCVLIAAWSVMSAIRSQAVPDYETAWENIKPVETAQGAFDIYSSSALIVEYFPDEIDYEYGRSLIPLALGWVPRSFWPDKPYPFSIYANTIRGETLEDRSASIAVGLPGEGYGNFGLPGVLLWGLLMGFACRVADDYLKKFDASDPLRLFLGASICIWAAMIVRGGVPEMFYMGLQVNVFPIVLSLVLKAMQSRSRRTVREKLAAAPRLLESPSGLLS